MMAVMPGDTVTLEVSVRKKGIKVASKPHRDDTRIYVVLWFPQFNFEVRLQITSIHYAQKAKDENTRYNISGGYARVT